MILVQGVPKQTWIFEMTTTHFWVNLGKKSNWILQWGKDNIWNHVLELRYVENCALCGSWYFTYQNLIKVWLFYESIKLRILELFQTWPQVYPVSLHNFVTQKLLFLGDLHYSGTKNWESLEKKWAKKLQKHKESIKLANFYLIMSYSLQDTVFIIS